MFNLDESRIHYAQWKEPGPKGYMLYDFTYMAFWKKPDHRDRKQTGLDFQRHSRELSGMMEMFYILIWLHSGTYLSKLVELYIKNGEFYCI